MAAVKDVQLSQEKIEYIPNSFVINIDKDPVELLYNVFTNVQSSFVKIVGAHNKCSFEVTMRINNTSYTATGRTYQLAKKSVSLTVLNVLSNVFYDPNKLQLYIHVPVPGLKKLSQENIKIVNNITEMEPKDLDNCLSNDVQQLTAIEVVNKEKSVDLPYKEPLIIQEILDVTPSGIANKLKSYPLKNISNLPKINVKCVQKSNSQVITTNMEHSTPIKGTDPPQFNISFNMLTETTTQSTTTVQSVIEHSNVCVRSFAKNPINFEEPIVDSVTKVLNTSEGKSI